MKITILCVGKIREKYWNDAIAEYSRRLSRYCSLKIEAVADEATDENASRAAEEKVLEREGQRLLRCMDKIDGPDSAFIALAIKGKKLDSLQMSEKIASMTISGTSHICFLIGGSLGLSDKVLSRCDMKLSFSDLTFPHQMMRVILLEQIYRSFRIMNHEPYHK